MLSALTENVGDVARAIEQDIVLVARQGTRIVGAVRGITDGRMCHVGRLVVAPDMHRRGIGGRLLTAVELTASGSVDRFTLFTGNRSESNLSLYKRHGYEQAHSHPLSPEVTLVHWEKLA
ncbi:N-acetyltransferase [Pseudonocardiaceae bacterium YIM PH 21723]|nr:N-acetyltransferase [Pseudonocardiaceae bacterium YIM PH 21723]